MNRKKAYEKVLKCAEIYNDYRQENDMFFVVICGRRRFNFFLPSLQTVSKQSQKLEHSVNMLHEILNDNPELKRKFLSAAKKYFEKQKRLAQLNTKRKLLSIFSGEKLVKKLKEI